mmetsp:Transcript_12203/g.34324  ORF Transcript_12203/g.34324 Transcript_12203/m.34324 type:complete len:282 (-) Transcript_12203:278-1123(-)
MGGSERTPAASAKATGSNLYTDGDYSGAEAAFSEAIQLAGPADKLDLHIFYSNRCAARMQLGKLDEAIQDAIHCTKLAPRWAKGWSRLGTCQLQKGRPMPAVDSFTKASELEPSNATYKIQLENARAVLRPPPSASDGEHQASRSRPQAPSGPSMLEQAVAWGLQQWTAAQNWWSDLNPDQRNLLMAGAAIGVLFVMWQIYNSMFRTPLYADYGGMYEAVGWSWPFWILLLLAGWKLPPRFGYAPFFGMSLWTFIWILQMIQNNGRGSRRSYPGMYLRRRW